MKSDHEAARNTAAGAGIRNPFGVMDVPDPDDREVMQFAAGAPLEANESFKARSPSPADMHVTREKEPPQGETA